MERKGLEDSVTPERFARLREVFEGALERRDHERQTFIENACAGDSILQSEVMDMLTAEGKADVLLDGHPRSGAPEEGRFPAGTLLAGRYRILGMLGKGGMGEVYRAHDMILNQTVALKFLSPSHVGESALHRFRTEVRIARQVSHPNVCRVYDLGMVEGQYFLSMEYIDGEDLASLLRRIGRLPEDKAVEFTRKICAGLAAAHDRGVLHRDLKPGNIMIDGRGQPRITDFGLAALAQEIPLSDLRSGTPAYMSPEQKAGKEVTLRSDLYSLGLVLHEMFTGKARKDATSTPSELVRDMNPAIERLILRCLEEDPRRRPPSALNVSMALPGADPIAAALAAGETPSPEMVAASREMEGFSMRTATLCVAAVVIAAIVTAFFSFNSRLLRIAALGIPPDGLAFHAREILSQLGYTAPPKTTVYGFDCCDRAVLAYANEQETDRRDAILSNHRPAVIRFWYREHQDLIFEAPGPGNGRTTPVEWTYAGITYASPANIEPGMIRLLLDPKGRLLTLEVRPVFTGTPPEGARNDIDWSRLFLAAGLDEARFTSASPGMLPSMAFDARAAWTGSYGESPKEQVHVEAAGWNGRPVYFSVHATDVPSPGPIGSTGSLPFWTPIVLISIVVFACLAAVAVAFHNVRAGRGDRTGSAKIAFIVGLSTMCAWILTASHIPDPWEMALIVGAVGQTAFFAGLSCLAYLAIEPYMRRYWPESLISWNRAQAGRIRDPLVASHILAGITAWMGMGVLTAPLWQLRPVWTPEQIVPLDSIGHFAAFLVMTPARVFPMLITALLIIVVIRLATPQHLWLGNLLACAVLTLTGPVDYTSAYTFATSAAIVFPTVFVTMIWLSQRFGLMAVLSAWTVRWLMAPMVIGSWYAGRGMVVQLIPVAIAAWALWVIVSARRAAVESAA